MSETLVGAATQTLVPLIGDLSDADKRGTTITRTLIRLYIVEAAVNSAKSTMVVVLGMGVASQEALGIGATAIPTVGVSVDRPRLGWYFRDEVMVPSSGSDATRPMPFTTVRADIRAQRRLENGEFYLVMANGSAIGPSFTVAVRGLVRVFLRLP